jgi:DNA-binding PadR family transcriptional regulator
MLEDLGYARARPEESGKKIYEITEEGRAPYASKSASRSPEQIRKIKEILDRAASEIEAV